MRVAVCGDAEAMARVHVASWRSTYRGLMPETTLANLSVERRAAQWRRALCDGIGGVFAFVALDGDGEIVGFASGSAERSGDPLYTGEVQAIYLYEHAQGHGHGLRLMGAVAARLAAIGHGSMLLRVLDTNAHARRFYEQLGGVPLRSQLIEMDGATLTEVAYGWPDLAPLIALVPAGSVGSEASS